MNLSSIPLVDDFILFLRDFDQITFTGDPLHIWRKLYFGQMLLNGCFAFRDQILGRPLQQGSQIRARSKVIDINIRKFSACLANDIRNNRHFQVWIGQRYFFRVSVHVLMMFSDRC